MKLLRHWKLILGLSFIFAAGVITGALITIKVVKKIIAEQSTLHWWVDSRLREMDRRLKLTPEQREKIKPIIEKAGGEFQGIAGEAMGDVMALLQRTHHEVSQELTPEQQIELHQIEADAMQRWKEFTSPNQKKKGKSK